MIAEFLTLINFSRSSFINSLSESFNSVVSNSTFSKNSSRLLSTKNLSKMLFLLFVDFSVETLSISDVEKAGRLIARFISSVDACFVKELKKWT